MLRMINAAVLGLAVAIASQVLPFRPAAATAPPSHTLAVTGTGVGLYPAYQPSVERYAVTTTGATGGSLSVEATTSDPGGVVLVDGRPAPAGRATVTGLVEGDEVSVIIQDAAGSEVHSLVYLPAGFPTLTETVPAAATVTPGDLLINLSRSNGDGSPNFLAAVDHRGVPVMVRSFAPSQSVSDLKSDGPAGHFTYALGPTAESGRTGTQLVELDSSWREVRRFSTVGLTNTDAHDSILGADGHRFLIAYEPNPVTHLTDAVIQEVDAQGAVVYTWNSGDHLVPADETTNPGSPDYAHVNSVRQLPDGDLLVSFRHLSAVYRIAWHDHDGFHRGDVVWRLGGRHSDFTFVDDPLGGPCAQHYATLLPNGHVMVFDNGSVAFDGDQAHCVDQADPSGPTIERRLTRVAEYALDTSAHTATLVWSYAHPGGWYALFAGSAQRFADGNTLIGWAAEKRAIASEVDAGGQLLWELRDDDQYLSYRSVLADVPDTIDPTVSVASPAAGASYAFGAAPPVPDFTCTDRGGSSLQTCTGTRTPLDTRSPGLHTYTVTATDGAGNVTTVHRDYRVAAAPYSRPDALIRTPGHGWVGNNVHGTYTHQRVAQRLARSGSSGTAYVAIQGEGNRRDRYRVRSTGGSSAWHVSWYAGRTDVTSRVLAGTWRPVLSVGETSHLRLVVTRLAGARPGSTWRVVVGATSQQDPRQHDLVALDVRAVR